MDKWKEIFFSLKLAGISVYFPGAHRGVCIEPYCVVQPIGGTLQADNAAAGRVRYRIHLLAPYDEPGKLDELARGVRSALSGMAEKGSLSLAQPRGAVVIDEARSALSSFIDYVSYYSET